ncbi:hypothetical protein QFC22_002968 [Naganishia vaughanmartiniae]|uniref:Uncharacterized protein n=1 Tax=Naganishia vaughanmartiniae TaxID=1424756 RepID=A0ACC2X7N9_9TREE|nr:hypothetical protein QFC22_002968 [Naganishia vaughanmartiniae]
MNTHAINEQARVAQLTSRDLASQAHFEVNRGVKQEPEYHDADNILEGEEDEKQLENGSIVYDDNGRAYRYYASESAYQAATSGDVLDTPVQVQRNQQQIQQTTSSSLPSNGMYNQDSPFVSMQLQSSLGNAAPISISPSMPTDLRNDYHRELAAPFESWMPGNGALNISAGVSLQRSLMLGNAGAAIQEEK